MELKKVGVLSLAKITTIFGAITGIVVSIIFAVLKRMMASIPIENAAALQTIANFTIGSAFFIIIQYIILGFVYGIIAAFLYNLLAKYIGGVKIELSK